MKLRGVGFAILVALLITGGTVACTTATPAKPGVGVSTPASGLVLGTPYRETASAKWVNDISELPAGAVSHVDVVYFHRTERCTGCLNAESYTRETIETYFADQLANGRLSLRVLDMEKAENAALVKKYDAAGSALYLSVVIQGNEYLCPNPDIWFYTTNKYLFVNTLKKKLAALVGEV